MSAFSPMQTTYWAIDQPVPNSTYRPRFRMDEFSGMANYGYMGPSLNQGTWYRFEYHVEFLILLLHSGSGSGPGSIPWPEV
jgi:hypothetical protein